MDFATLLDKFTAAVAAGDGAAFAQCFTEDGVYDDVFYGEFTGREAIAGMLENLFHRDGEKFRWDMVNPVSDGRHGYAKWYFSYVGKAPHIAGQRIYMDGVGLFELRDGLISKYADLAKTAELFNQLNLEDDKRRHIVDRMTQQQLDQTEFTAHKQS